MSKIQASALNDLKKSWAGSFPYKFRGTHCSNKQAQLAIIHKPLPLSLFFIVLLRMTLFKGKICVVHSDWEGVGGYADVNYGNKFLKKMLTTFCEEGTPYFSDITFCASKVLLKRFSYTEKIQSKCIYIPCGGSPLNCTPPNFSQTEKRVIYVGTFNSNNLVDFLVTIIELVHQKSKEFHFTLIGGGTYFKILKESVINLKLDSFVTVTGQINRKNVVSYLEKAHFGLVYLNSEYPETYMEMSRSSTKIFEYMSSGKIILSSDFGEPKEIIKNGETGFLVQNTPEAFAQSIVEKYPAGILTEMSKKVTEDFLNNYSHDVLMKKLVDFSSRNNK